MKIFIIVFLVCISFYFLTQGFYWFVTALSILPKPVTKNKNYDENVSVEFTEAAAEKPRYDVEAYRERIRKMKETMDENGIFDWVDIPQQENVTGVEIIGENV